MRTVQELRQNYKVFVRHSRFYKQTALFDEVRYTKVPITKLHAEVIGYSSNDILAKGGFTSVEIFDKVSNVLLAKGEANCSCTDAFNRKRGLTIALGRALENLKMTSSVNWQEILSEVGEDNLRGFCNRQITRRQFESLGTVARRTVRQLGADEVRTRARKALSRRQAV